MVNCDTCVRAKPKHDERLDALGYIECKASANADTLMAAFNMYSVERRSTVPFKVVGAKGYPESVWPFQFQPASIEQCEGYIPIDKSQGLDSAG